MICENAYYPNQTGNNGERLYCKNEQIINGFTEGKCPLVYWCNISEKFENTADMFDCIYRGKTNE